MARKREGTAWFDAATQRWIVQFPLADGSRSKPQRLGPEVTDRDTAKKQAREWMERAAREGKTRDAPDGTVIAETYSTWAERWCVVIRDQGNARDARDKGGHLTKWIEPRIGPKPIATLGRADVEAWVEWIDERVRAGELSAKTAANAFGTLTRSLSEACASKVRALRVRTDNPAAGVRGPDEGVRKSKTYLYPAEFLALVSCPRVPLRWRRLFAIGAYTYARTGELEALEWEDVDLDRRRIHIHRAIERQGGAVKETKTNTPRRIPIEPELVPLLDAMKRDTETRADADPSSATGRVVDFPPTEDIPDRLRKYLAWAGVTRAELFANDRTRKQIGFYDASRATGITWMAIRGDEPLKIQQRAGHASFTTTQKYVREAENLEHDVGAPFPPLPPALLQSLSESLEGPAAWGLLRESTWKSGGVPSGIRTREISGARQGSPTPSSTGPAPDRSEKQGGSCEESGTAAPDVALGGPLPSSTPNLPNPGSIARPEAIGAPEYTSPEQRGDVVELALVAALERASAAGEWSVVTQLARELEARRTARAAPNVVDLERERARRER